jgi:hypothetical protein
MMLVQNERSPAPVAIDRSPEAALFAAGRPGFGSACLSLRIGPLVMRLEGLSALQADAVAERYRPFVAGGGPVASVVEGAADITVRIGPAGVDAFLAPPAPGVHEIYRMEGRRDGGRLTLWTYEFAGSLDAGGRRAELALVDPGGPLFFRGLENYLRILTAAFILEQGGFLLHAATVVRNGRAYVFFGPSGAGKTTVTLLSPRDRVLSDDLTLVVPGSAGWAAAGIPFGLAHHRVPESTGTFPIASFNRLIQAPVTWREPLPRSRALGEMLASLPFVMQETGQAGRALEVVAKALESVPVWGLRFVKDPGFWDVVEETRWI